jgi:hypothetical protein
VAVRNPQSLRNCCTVTGSSRPARICRTRCRAEGWVNQVIRCAKGSLVEAEAKSANDSGWKRHEQLTIRRAEDNFFN